MEAVYRVTALASLVAVWLNIKQRAVCFAIWAATNATWTVVDYLHGIHAQAALQLFYFALSIYGFVESNRRHHGKEVTDGFEDPT